MPTPTRVAFVLPSFAGGGAQRVLVTLASQLDRARFMPFFVVFEASGPWRSLVASHIPVISLGKTSLRAALPGLVRALRRERPDVIVSTLAYVNASLLFAKFLLIGNPRLIVREANTSRRHAHTAFGRMAYWLAYRLFYPRADRIVCPAAYLADELTMDYGIRRDRIVIVGNPLDEKAFRAAAASPQRRAGPGRRFIAVGRLTEQKGYDRLLDDFAQLPADSHLTIFGEGELHEAIERQIERLGLLGRVALAGFEPQPAPWIGGADAVLLPSRWEGLPNVALEALACGTPVVGTPESGGISEIVAQASPGAITLASPGQSFVAAMMSILPRQELSLRSSLLPDAYRMEGVTAKFAAVILR